MNKPNVKNKQFPYIKLSYNWIPICGQAQHCNVALKQINVFHLLVEITQKGHKWPVAFKQIY